MRNSSDIETEKETETKTINGARKHPFMDMKIDDNSILTQINERFPCSKCGKSRKFYCYSCHIPLEYLKDKLPKVEIPIEIDIIKHKLEIDGKSTAVHGAILCSNIKIYEYPDIPDYTKENGVVLIYPSINSVSISQLFNGNIQLTKKDNYGMPKGFNMGTLLRVRLQEENQTEIDTKALYTLENLPVRKAVFIDSTWNQSRSIFKDRKISSLKTVILQNRLSQFWRHQKKSPRWYLATIEAIHQFLLELHVNAWGLNLNYRGLDALEISEKFLENAKLIQTYNKNNSYKTNSYNGNYDNLLFFFSYMYDLIHFYYDHNKLKSYKRPI